MESVWDYVMRRKPLFLGYFLLFLISSFASFEFLHYLIPVAEPSAPGIVQETPTSSPEYDNQVLSPAIVATLDQDQHSVDFSLAPQLVHVDIVDAPTVATVEDTFDAPGTVTPAPEVIAEQSVAEVPLTSAPRTVSIFRTILAVLLAVTSLTLAGLGLYQVYEYFSNL